VVGGKNTTLSRLKQGVVAAHRRHKEACLQEEKKELFYKKTQTRHKGHTCMLPKSQYRNMASHSQVGYMLPKSQYYNIASHLQVGTVAARLKIKPRKINNNKSQYRNMASHSQVGYMLPKSQYYSIASHLQVGTRLKIKPRKINKNKMELTTPQSTVPLMR
jgi:hypothetical protein